LILSTFSNIFDVFKPNEFDDKSSEKQTLLTKNDFAISAPPSSVMQQFDKLRSVTDFESLIPSAMSFAPSSPNLIERERMHQRIYRK
jgi:hypothetical protein